MAGTASTEFWGGFFLRFGENCLHRILGRILFESWLELPPQNFGSDSLVGTASTLHRILGRILLRFGGDCHHRILVWILFEIRRELPPQNYGGGSFEIRQELPPQNFGVDSF